MTSYDVEVTGSEVKMLSNIANGVIYEQIVGKLSILSQTISDSDDVEVTRSDVSLLSSCVVVSQR